MFLSIKRVKLASLLGDMCLTALHGSPDIPGVFSLIPHSLGHRVHTQPDFKSSQESHRQENRT